MTNRAIESRAIELVISYETKRLRLSSSEGVKRAQRGSGYDLESPDGRKIEVKGTAGSDLNKGFRLNSRDEINFVNSGGYVYRVLDVLGAPRLHILSGDQLKVATRSYASVSVQRALVGDGIALAQLDESAP